LVKQRSALTSFAKKLLEGAPLVPASFPLLPAELAEIYRQVIKAHNHGLDILVLPGLRTVIECVCNDRGVEKSRDGRERRLRERVDQLKPSLPTSFQKYLATVNKIVKYANDALHDGKTLSSEDLKACVYFVEQLLGHIYDPQNK
jgi:hypothetical protein